MTVLYCTVLLVFFVFFRDRFDLCVVLELLACCVCVLIRAAPGVLLVVEHTVGTVQYSTVVPVCCTVSNRVNKTYYTVPTAYLNVITHVFNVEFRMVFVRTKEFVRARTVHYGTVCCTGTYTPVTILLCTGTVSKAIDQ